MPDPSYDKETQDDATGGFGEAFHITDMAQREMREMVIESACDGKTCRKSFYLYAFGVTIRIETVPDAPNLAESGESDGDIGATRN